MYTANSPVTGSLGTTILGAVTQTVVTAEVILVPILITGLQNIQKYNCKF